MVTKGEAVTIATNALQSASRDFGQVLGARLVEKWGPPYWLVAFERTGGSEIDRRALGPRCVRVDQQTGKAERVVAL